MADVKKQFCRLCLSVVTDKSFTIIDNFTKDMLDLVLLQLNFDNATNIMCSDCSVKLFAAFEFKSACLYTNNTIRAYADGEKELQLDIRDIYMKEMEDKELVDISDDRKVCRLCMRLVGGEFRSILDVDPDVLQSYIPEMNVNFTSDPVICKVCCDALHSHAGFLKTCINAQGEIENDFEIKDTACVKNENVKIETIRQEEETNEWMETEEFRIKSEECGTDNLVSQQLDSHDESEVQTPQLLWSGNHIEDYRMNQQWDLACPQLEPSDASEVRMYQCDECDYRTKRRNYLKQHQLKHRDASEVQMYKCNNCEYQTKFKACLGVHMLKHNLSVARTHKCNECDFESKYRNTLVTHQLRHKDLSETRMFKCKDCDYQTNRKTNLTAHEVKHRDVSEVQMYECEECDYRAKQKRYLVRHRLKHRDSSEVPMYKCNNCDYQTKFKGCLTIHMVKHDSSGARMFKCKDCDFQTKYRNTLANHRVTHKDLSESQVYKCNDCEFSTKRKANLTTHKLTHRDPSEVQMYKCKECDCETKFKSTLARHQRLMHAHASEARLYECEECDFRTKYKSNLAGHQLRHANNTVMQVYKCDKCDLEIKCDEKCLARHQLWHKKMCVTSVANADTAPSTSQG